jgi:hypothetical protein
MNGSKKARNASAISNRTSVFGIMGGLAPRHGHTNVAAYRNILKRGAKPIFALNGKTPAQQRIYLQNNNLLSVNPLTSGGVGKKTLMFR